MKKIIIRFRTFWDKVPNWLQDVLAFITSLVSLIGIVYGGAQLVINVVSKIVPQLPIDLPWLICLLLTVIIMFMRAKMKQYKSSLWIRLRSDAASYYDILHDFRNFYFDVLKYHKDKKLNKEFLTTITREYLINMLEKLCNIYKAYTGKDMNACIKLIGKENEDINFDKIDKENATVYTFVRSKNISKQREDASDNQAVLISKNTDFSYIISPPDFYKKQYFYEQDIHLFDEELKKHQQKYENTTENYWDFYRAAIVVPIRIAHSHLHFTAPTDPFDYHIVGFLCIDTKSTHAFIPEYEEQFIQIAKSFAAIIYVIMNKYNFYLQKCKNGYAMRKRNTKSAKGENENVTKIK